MVTARRCARRTPETASPDKAMTGGKPIFVIFNDEAASRRKSVAEETWAVLAQPGIEVASQVIESRIIFEESQDQSRAALETDRGSPAAAEIRALYAWMTQQLNRPTAKPHNRQTAG